MKYTTNRAEEGVVRILRPIIGGKLKFLKRETPGESVSLFRGNLEGKTGHVLYKTSYINMKIIERFFDISQR